jgi:hypothetical protein
MIAKGWHPSAVAALEEAMEPKFLRDMRAAKAREAQGEVVEGEVVSGSETSHDEDGG